MSMTTSLAIQSAIMRANNAEMAAIRESQAEQDLLNHAKPGDFDSIARKEAHLDAQRLRAETKAKAAKAELEALEKKESKRKKLDTLA